MSVPNGTLSAVLSLLLLTGCRDHPDAASTKTSASESAPPAEGAEPTHAVSSTPPAETEPSSPSLGSESGATPPALDPPEPPPIAPPPPAASATEYGLAAYEVVTIYAKPDLSSTKLGYLRFGHRTMVTPRIEDHGEGCRKGWHQLSTGGYACLSKGLTVDPSKEPYMHQPPPRPQIDRPMPYDYGVVTKDGTEMWWRPADPLERELSAEKFAIEQQNQAAENPDAQPKPKPKPKPKPEPEDVAPRLPGLADLSAPPTPTPPPLTEEERAQAQKQAEQARLREQEELQVRRQKMSALPLHPEHPFLERGFVITTAMKIRDKGRTWWRTSRGGYLDASKIARRGSPKIVELGATVPEDSGFPFAFVGRDPAAVFTMQPDGTLRRSRSIEARSFVNGLERLTIGSREYLHTTDDLYLRISDLRLAQPQPLPEGVGDQERWIDVELEQQLLVAYEGLRPVFTTLISSGRKGSKEEPFDTPTGIFRIQTKHISSSMDGDTASDGAYSIQDVPWAMFFHGNYALHGAFWHSSFGRPRSHGCINLAPGDARWLFWWVGPELPEGWHGAAAHEQAPGTVVVVR